MFDGIEMTLLSREEIEKGPKQLDVIKKYGVKCGNSDFAILTCGCCNLSILVYDNIKKPINDSMDYWLRSKSEDGLPLEYNPNDEKIDEGACSWSTVSIRPVLNLSPAMFEEITSKKKESLSCGVDVVNLGYYASSIVNKSLQKKLNKRKPGTYDEANDSFIYNTAEFDSDEVNLLEDYTISYKGNLYLDVTTNFAVEGERANDFKIVFGNLKVSQNDKVWVKVEPISWLIDYKTHKLVCTKIIAVAPKFDTSREYDGDFEKTYIYKFMNDCILPKMFQSTELKFNSKKVNVKTLLDEIAKYKMYYLGEEDIVLKVNGIISDYNEKVKNVENEQDSSGLTVECNNLDYLYGQLQLELSTVLDKLKQDYMVTKDYYAMLEVLSGKSLDSELSRFVCNIKEIISNNKILEKEKKQLLNSFYSITNKHKKKIKGYILECKINSEAKAISLNELEQEFRSDLQPFLVKLNNTVEKMDIVNEILTGVKAIIEDKYEETKNQRAKYLLDLIHEVAITVKNEGTPNDLEKLKEICDFQLDYNKDICTILNGLNEIFKEVYKIELDIKERKALIRRKNDSTINYDLNTVLKGSSFEVYHEEERSLRQ